MPGDDTIALPFLLTVLVFLPGLGIYSWYHLKRHKPLRPKKTRYVSLVIFESSLLLMALGVAHFEGISLLGTAWPPLSAWLLGGTFVTAVLVRLHQRWKRLSDERKDRIRLLLPETPMEFAYWAPISILVGFAEEFAYRGVLYDLLHALTNSTVVALIVCVVAFALAHLAQGWKAMFGLALFALLFHLSVFLTGTLHLAIAVHAAYDLFLGLVVMKLFMRDKFDAAQPAQPEFVS